MLPLLILILRPLPLVFSAENPAPAPGLFFSPDEDIRRTNSYQKVQDEFHKKGANLERLKIEYLMDRVRHSPNKFIRNGTVHTSAGALQHLRRKYAHKFQQTGSAQMFIHSVASYSTQTGEPYTMQTSDGKTCPVKDIFLNELRRLEETLQEPPSG